jgi:signal transduction histidine kinase
MRRRRLCGATCKRQASAAIYAAIPLANAVGWGGYWLAVQRSSPASQQLWVYASPGTALPWLWPAIRIGSLLLGGSSGMALFLQWQLQRPIQQLLKQLPAIPSGELELVPEAGMGAMRELSIRINRVLEQLNQQHESRRRFLQGLAHDLGSPLTRLSMRVERLEDQPADPQHLGRGTPAAAGGDRPPEHPHPSAAGGRWGADRTIPATLERPR